MAKYLGMDPGDKSCYWIAEEALNAALPPGWMEHKTSEGAVYYYSANTKESSWEHPADAYYRFMYKKMRRMRKQRQRGLGSADAEGKQSMSREGPYSSAERERDRQLVDVLWNLKQEKKEEEVRMRVAGMGLLDSSGNVRAHAGAAESVMQKLIVTDTDKVPAAVKDITDYLGINLSNLSAPLTIAEVEEMADYLGIDVVKEPCLLPLAKTCLITPLPRGWAVYKDDAGEAFYHDNGTGETSYRHPVDEYFIKKVKEDRNRYAQLQHERLVPHTLEPWCDFTEASTGDKFWYNFATRRYVKVQPPGWKEVCEAQDVHRRRVDEEKKLGLKELGIKALPSGAGVAAGGGAYGTEMWSSNSRHTSAHPSTRGSGAGAGGRARGGAAGGEDGVTGGRGGSGNERGGAKAVWLNATAATEAGWSAAEPQESVHKALEP